VARAGLQVVAQQRAEVGQQSGRCRRVEAVAAVVDPDTGDVERAGEAADAVGPLEHGDRMPAPGGLPGSGQAGRAGAEHDDRGGRHGPRR
jgi:hypothetical protein